METITGPACTWKLSGEVRLINRPKRPAITTSPLADEPDKEGILIGKLSGL